MSVTRSPLRNDSLRRAEERADAQRTAAIIGGFLFLAACAFVIYIAWRAA